MKERKRKKERNQSINQSISQMHTNQKFHFLSHQTIDKIQ